MFVKADEQQIDDPTTVSAEICQFDGLVPAPQNFDGLEARSESIIGVNPRGVRLGDEGHAYILSDSGNLAFRNCNVVATTTFSGSAYNPGAATVSRVTEIGEYRYAEFPLR